ncbi:MAG TPA: ATP-dependent Clp protease ATP-binding subunit [Candidatus Polarisedimenticolia bacterium]|nr:ATP-dependent Clp protease ATP-binding subunit [Candidatus Polarisedimenticolia bacterium]
MFEKYTEKAKKVLFLARYEASQMGSKVIGSEHLLLGLIKEGDDLVRDLFGRSSVNLELLRAELEARGPSGEKPAAPIEIPFSEETKKILACAEEEAERLLHPYVSDEHILLGLLRVEDSAAGRILAEKGMRLYALREDTVAVWKQRALPKKVKETPFLNEFSRDLSEMAARQVFDPLVGRENELQRMIQVLSRRRKNSIVLLGEPGVGKTALVEGLAQRIAEGSVPVSLSRKRILALDLCLIVAGTKYRGQFEERLKGIISEIIGNEDIIIFIDEIHSLIGAGSAEGSLDAASIIKPALSRGEVQCIGATTPKDYHRYIEKDRALVRRFQPIRLHPPTEDETILILRGVKERYEKFHQVRYTEEGLRASVALSNRYITDRFLPDKAIDVIDEAGARVKLRRRMNYREIRDLERDIERAVSSMKNYLFRKDFEKAVKQHDEEIALRKKYDEFKMREEEERRAVLEVVQEDIEEVISKWTGIPISSVKKEEAERLLKMEEFLHRRIVGQDEAISALARATRRQRAGLKNPLRPVGSFIFLGPTGVGKTEVAKGLAEFLFGDEKSLVRFDMSEYMEKHAIAKMIGSPPGYVGYEEGGQLTERVKRRPYSVILLDEIEKAHPDVLNVLLQVLEDGQITDAFGDTIDFKNGLVVMTSNIGSHLIQRQRALGFRSPDDRERDYRERRELVLKEVKSVLHPEFINRVDEIIVFDALSDEDLLAIARLMISQLNSSLADRGIRLTLTDEAYRWLIDKTCSDRSYGARPLRRAIQKNIEDALSESLILGKFPENGEIEIFVDQERLAFREPIEIAR